MCWSHGGATSRVRAAAQRRLEAAQADRRMQRRFGRGLNTLERSWFTQDSTELHREVRDLLAQIKAGEGT